MVRWRRNFTDLVDFFGQISGAKVKLHDVRPGSSERMVEISGTPEQAHAAQSLLQAFILSGQSSSLGPYPG